MLHLRGNFGKSAALAAGCAKQEAAAKDSYYGLFSVLELE